MLQCIKNTMVTQLNLQCTLLVIASQTHSMLLVSDANRKVANGLRLSDKTFATFIICQKISEQILLKRLFIFNKNIFINIWITNFDLQFYGTSYRRVDLKSTWAFDCCCPRCKDPTENGSNVSAVVCENCKFGYALPIDPCDYNSEW